ncbi:MAG: hypothetical protein ACRCXB_26770 [Aeromonadaceae bacterium]
MRYAMVIRKGKQVSRYARDFHEVQEVLSDPPKTWLTYESDPQKYQKIIDMEHAEMAAAKAIGDHHAYTENMIHLAAALLCAHHAMTCKEDD